MTRASRFRNVLISAAVSTVVIFALASSASANLTKVGSGRDVWVSLSIHGDSLYWSSSQNGVRDPKSSIYRTYLPDMTTTKLLNMKRGELVTRIFSGDTRLAIETSRYVPSGKKSIVAEGTTVYGFDLASSTLVKFAGGTRYADYKSFKICGQYPSVMGVFADSPLYTVKKTRRSGDGRCRTLKTRTDFFNVPGSGAENFRSPATKLGSINRDAYAGGYFAGQLVYASGDDIRVQRIGQAARIISRANKSQVPVVEMHESGQVVTSFLRIGKDGYVNGIGGSRVYGSGMYDQPSRIFGGTRRVVPCGEQFVSYSSPRASRIDRHENVVQPNGDFGSLSFSRRDVSAVTCNSQWLAFASVAPGNRDLRILASSF